MFRMLYLGKRTARLPMRIEHVFVRLAQRRPQQPCSLRFPPRHCFVAERSDEALHDLKHMRLRLVVGARARNIARLGIGIATRRL